MFCKCREAICTAFLSHNQTPVYMKLVGLPQIAITSSYPKTEEFLSCSLLKQNELSDGQMGALQMLTELFNLPNTHPPVTHTHTYRQRHTHSNLVAKNPQCAGIQTEACCSYIHMLSHKVTGTILMEAIACLVQNNLDFLLRLFLLLKRLETHIDRLNLFTHTQTHTHQNSPTYCT